jgi:hypothetical protein
MIIQTISTAGQFRDQFARMGRKDQFSYQALGLLFDYLDSIDNTVELDVIGICCEFAEDTEQDIRDNYRIPEDESVEDYLIQNTLLLGKTDAGYVFAQF